MTGTSRKLIATLLFIASFSPAVLHAGSDSASNVEHEPSGGRHGRVYVDELAFGSGYAWGSRRLTQGDIRVIPLYFRLGLNLNHLVGLSEGSGTLQLAFEPFINSVIAPEKGVETGLDFFIRYLHPLFPSVKLVSEIGSGPMYLSINTVEQGKAGFNFMNQIGLGLQKALTDNTALTVGYRFRHISDAGIRSPNSGLNSNAIVVSFSMLY